MTERTFHSLKVRDVIEETADSKSLVFDVPPPLAETFRYRPGQFLTLRVLHQGRHLLRCYSLCSSPLTDDPPRVTVKRMTDGRVSNWICDHVRAGTELDVLPPAGHFTPRSLEGDFLFFAGGSGITPVFSIMRSAQIAGAGRQCLIYANRDERSVIFRDELKMLAGTHSTRLQIIHWLDSVQGVPSVTQLEELARPWRHSDCYVCGPELFMDAAVQALHSLGVEPSKIHVERFVSLPDEEDVPAIGAPAEGGGTIRLEVDLDGMCYELTCGEDEPLLDAMLREGIKAPHSCRSGACGSCMCTLEAGEVHLRRNQVLNASDLKERWILACQAIADTAAVKIRFPD